MPRAPKSSAWDAPLPFTGFPAEGLAFLAGLEADNSRAYFEAHRAVYDEAVFQPARSLVFELGMRLSRRIAPGLCFDPSTRGSLFRIHRDTRFSADKRPYKTHVGLFLWEGSGGRLGSPGFYVQVEPGKVMFYTGIYAFPPDALERYRHAVDDPRQGARLARLEKAAALKPYLPAGGDALKRVPAPYPPDHPRASWLKHKGVFIGLEVAPPPAEVHTAALADLALAHFEAMAPFHQWLVKALA